MRTIADLLASIQREDQDINQKGGRCPTNTKSLKATASLTRATCTRSTQRGGNSSKSLIEADTYTFTLSVGDIIPVGEFFWIDDNDMIGHDHDAQHGHGAKDGGSVDVGCTLTIRGIEEGYAVVRLDRPRIPYGAPAAIGTVFQIPIAIIASWPQKLAEIRDRERQRCALEDRYCK